MAITRMAIYANQHNLVPRSEIGTYMALIGAIEYHLTKAEDAAADAGALPVDASMSRYN